MSLATAAHTVLVGSTFVAQGSDVAKLEKQEKELTLQVQQAQKQLTQQTATQSVSELALANGFLPTTNVFSVPADFVASR